MRRNCGTVKRPCSPKTAPPLPQQAWNLARSLRDFVADCCVTVDKNEYRRRLEICDGCEYRKQNRCLVCGCNLSLKARGRAFKCPKGKWAAPVGPRRPTVAIVAQHLAARSGGILSLHALATKFVDRGFVVYGVSTSDAPHPPNGMRVVQVSPTQMDRFVDHLPTVPDAVISTPGDLPLSCDDARRHNVPLIVYVQFWRGLLKVNPRWLRCLDSGEPIPAEAFDQTNLARLAGAAAVVANSAYAAEKVERITGRACDAVVQPYLGEVGLNGREWHPRHVIMPSAQWLKGAKRFLALAKANPTVPFLLLAGDRMRQPEVIDAAQHVPNVTIERHWLSDMHSVWAQARALFLATETCETFGRAAAEARACGVPILALRAGNLPNIVGEDGGVCVDRDASDADWQAAFEKTIAMEPKPTTEFAQDHRPRMIRVLNQVRRLPEVYMLLPRAPGIRAAVEQAARVLGVTTVPWNGPVGQYANARLIVCPWQVPAAVLRLGKPTLLWWHSHCAQMDITRRELHALATAWDQVAALPYLSIAFSHRAEAELWERLRPGRSFYLPAVLDCQEHRHRKRGGVFLPGPYEPRKNVATALAACRALDGEVHVTSRIRKHPELLRFAVAIECPLQIHECPEVADVQAVAGSCDLTLMLSTIETYCYAAAESVLAGTSVVCWAGLPALRAKEPRPWHVADPTDVSEVVSVARRAQPDWHSQQLADVRAVAADQAAAARQTLLDCLQT